MLIKRHIISQIEKSLNNYPIILITGARQVGKTTLVSYFEKYKKYKYISFDDTALVKEAKRDIRLFLKKYKYPLIIDEVQNVPEIFNELQHIVNDIKRKSGYEYANGMYILTGSQKFSLMKGVTESMSGRVGIIELEPLSQAEIRNWDPLLFEVDNDLLHNLENDRFLSYNTLLDSIVRGFYPGRWEKPGNIINDFYKNYIKTYIERDVSQLINIYQKKEFQNFITILASLTGQELIIDNLSKIVGVDNKTINSWLSILLTSNLITLLNPYYEYSIKKRIVKRKKLYFNDTGLACYLLHISTAKILQSSIHKGQIIETYIFNEIKKTYINQNIEPTYFYYRDQNQNEIDLVLIANGKLNLIQCKSNHECGVNDIKAFKQLEKTSYQIKGKCVICLTEDSYKICNDIFAYPIKVI